jgi:hypothetical protein
MTRIIRPLELIASERSDLAPFWIQRGVTELPAGWSGSATLVPSELSASIGQADIIITHGGPATISEARAAGKIPIVVPRSRACHEHVDDHQLRYAKHLAAAQEIVLAEDPADLPAIIRNFASITSGMPSPRRQDPEPAVRKFKLIASALEHSTPR